MVKELMETIYAQIQKMSAVTLAYNLKTKDEVNEIFELARKAGATIAKELQDVFWGGYHAYFSDPDEYYWEVVWCPRLRNACFLTDETATVLRRQGDTRLIRHLFCILKACGEYVIEDVIYSREKERHYPLQDNASLSLFRIGLGYGSISFPIKPCLFIPPFLSGIDIGAGYRTAVADGVVTTAAYDAGGYGNYLIIDHGNGNKTLYTHMSQSQMSVGVGQTVKRDQTIGFVGQHGIVHRSASAL